MELPEAAASQELQQGFGALFSAAGGQPSEEALAARQEALAAHSRALQAAEVLSEAKSAAAGAEDGGGTFQADAVDDAHEDFISACQVGFGTS